MTIENITREDHIKLAMILIIASADCADFFTYTDADEVKLIPSVVTGVLFVFSLSIVQFSVTLTATRKCRENRNELTKFQKFLDIFLGTELWSIFFVMITQDIPFLLIRLVLVFRYNVLSDSIIFFFIIKNCILVYFDIYRSYFIIRDYFRNQKSIEPEDKKENSKN